MLIVVLVVGSRPTRTNSDGIVVFTVGETTKEVEFYEGDNAFELFIAQDEFDVDYDSSSFGIFINGINNVYGENTGKIDEDGWEIWTYWALYVNNEYSFEALDKILLEDGILIEFRYGE